MRQEFAEIARETTQKRRSFLEKKGNGKAREAPRLSQIGKNRRRVTPSIDAHNEKTYDSAREQRKWQQFRISKIDINREQSNREDSVQRKGSIQMFRRSTSSRLRSASLFKVVLLLFLAFDAFTVLLYFSGFKLNQLLGPAWKRFQSIGMSEAEISENIVLDAVDTNTLKSSFFDMGPEQARAAVSDLTKINCVIFSIVVQVTTILIQVGAREVSSNAIQLFVSDKFIVGGMTLYTLTLSFMVVLTNSTSEVYVPRGEIMIASLFTLASVLLLIPYFMYLSRLLNPLRLVRKVAEAGLKACTYVENAEAVQRKTDGEIERDRKMAIWAVENISQFALNAIQHKRIQLVYACIEVLCHFLIGYSNRKDLWDRRWFKITDIMREKPDFFSLSDRGAQDLEHRRCWLEWKVLRQFQNMFTESFDSMKDVSYVIAVNTRQIAEAAAQRHDYHAMEYCIRYFNTFVRVSINKRDGQTARNVLHQYTLLCNSVLSNDSELLNLVQQRKRKALTEGLEFHQVDDLIQIRGNYVVEESRDIIIAMEKKMIAVAGHFAFYSNIAVQAGVMSVSENIAHELASVCETAFLQRRESHEEILLVLLTMHEAPREKNLQAVTWGIRAAQIKLATFYANNNGMEFFTCIQNTFRHASRADLVRVWRRLEKVQAREFWEVLNLEKNHEYITPECKEYLPLFFEPFGLTNRDIETNLTVVQQESTETNFMESTFGIFERGISEASFRQNGRPMMLDPGRAMSFSPTMSLTATDSKQDFVLPLTEEKAEHATDEEEFGAATTAHPAYMPSNDATEPTSTASSRIHSTAEEVLHIRRRASDVSSGSLVDMCLGSLHSMRIVEDENEDENEDSKDEAEESFPRPSDASAVKINEARLSRGA
ncbi:Hypothetical Protein FCC1311_053992 [Hondaea fermentalgiana]|uniref:Uncharacterized protein n=1 Tax=Hondaea fermentalgiana TaxID=2315210 RepID=A0A2R5GE15_9STRA|nr:Hypothetical Protein FCC1311_053992 [Hondaea fermentalgiana]|eukprot:GBG29177.1 Hypothetical Protein FCC1311_053992 [Hondaea fermentalgiana]